MGAIASAGRFDIAQLYTDIGKTGRGIESGHEIQKIRPPHPDRRAAIDRRSPQRPKTLFEHIQRERNMGMRRHITADTNDR
jgi:hypothetical protein